MRYKKYGQKYHNNKTQTLDGIVHDSYREAVRWEQLLSLQRAGEITNLRRQVAYELIPNQYETYERYSDKGKRLKDGIRLVERKVEYVADFVYHDAVTGECIVEDTKGFKTKDYIIKRKLMYAVHSIRIREI